MANFKSGEKILEERKKQFNSKTEFISGDDILFSRGKPNLNYDVEIAPLRKKKPTVMPSQVAPITKPQSTPVTTSTKPITKDLPFSKYVVPINPDDIKKKQENQAVIKQWNPTAWDKIKSFMGKAGDKVKSFAYGLGGAAGGNAINNIFNNSLKKSNGGRLPEGYSREGDVENYFADNYNTLKNSGMSDKDIENLRKQKIAEARAQDNASARRYFRGENLQWEPTKADQYTEAAGNVAGEVVKMLGIGKVAGAFTGGISNPMVKQIVNRTLTGIGLGGVKSVENNSDVGDTLKNLGRETLFMNAGGAASDIVGGLTGSILKNTALRNSILAEIGRQGLKGAAFGAGGTAATIPTYSEEEKPDTQDIISSAVAGALFEMLPGVFNTIKTSKVNKQILDEGLKDFVNQNYGGYREARAIRTENPTGAVERYSQVISNIDDTILALQKNRYVGQNKRVNQIIDMMEALKDRVNYERSLVINTNKGSSNILSGENPVPKADYTLPQLMANNQIVNVPEAVSGGQPVNIPSVQENINSGLVGAVKDIQTQRDNTPISQNNVATPEEKQIYTQSINEAIGSYDTVDDMLKNMVFTKGKYNLDELYSIEKDLSNVESLGKSEISNLYKKYIGGKSTSFSKQKSDLSTLKNNAAKDIPFLEKHYNYFGMPKLIDMYDQLKNNKIPEIQTTLKPSESKPIAQADVKPNITKQFAVGDSVETTNFGTVKVTDFDGSVYTLENKKGTELKVGKDALINMAKVNNQAQAGGVKPSPKTELDETYTNNIVQPEKNIKLGRYGKNNFKKWGENEYVNADLSNPNNEYTKKYKQFFDFWYNHGLQGTDKRDLTFNLPEHAYMDFPPFLQDVFYNAGVEDKKLENKKDEKQNNKGIEASGSKEINKPVETSDKSNTIEVKEDINNGENLDEVIEAKSPVEEKIDKLDDKLNKIIEKIGGSEDVNNQVSTDNNRNNVQGSPEKVPSENVPGTSEQGDTGENTVSNTGEGKRGNGKPDRPGNESRPGMGSSEGTNISDTGEPKRQINKASNPKGDDYIINSQDDVIKDLGKKVRYKNNVEAIKTMKRLELVGRRATPEEQKILAKYVGWGGLAEAFTKESVYNRETRNYTYKGKQGWEEEYEELKSLLTEEEYRLANDTILNAHYTSIPVIKGMYEGLKHFGFTGGNVLEPAAGIGNFIGAIPTELRNNINTFTGIEIDSITGRIAKLLYPNSDIRIQGFEKAKLPKNYYDVAISNVPFGKIIINDKNYPPAITRAIHNYFFAKSVDTVRPGGLIMYITSSFTMDGKDTSGIRAYIKSKADLIGAVRLPNTAFKENAGTEVTTDILILKVREPNAPYSGQPFSDMADYKFKYNDYERTEQLNEYYAAHPENMLGEVTFDKNGMYGTWGIVLKGDGRDLSKAISESIKRMPSNMITYKERKSPEKLQSESDAADKKQASKKTKEGSFEVSNGKLHINQNGQLTEVDIDKKSKDIIIGMTNIRQKARELLDLQVNNAPDKNIVAARKELNKLYDGFVKRNGYINKPQNLKLIMNDPDMYFLMSLENYDKKTKIATKTDIFSINTIKPYEKIETVGTSKEAMLVSLNETGSIDIERMKALTGKPEKEILKDLTGLVYKNPKTEKLETADQYLAGNVRAKLREAEAIATVNPEYQANVEALKAVQPVDKKPHEISVKLGSALITPDMYSNFTKELFGEYSDVRVTQNDYSGEWSVHEAEKPRYSIKKRTENTKTWGIEKRGFSGMDIMEKVMNNRSLMVFDTFKDPDGKQYKVLNNENTAIVQEKAEKMKQLFNEWVSTYNNGETIKEIAKNYNETFNTNVSRKYDGSHLTLPGSNSNIKLKPHQKEAIWRVISSGGNTLLAHEVGAGKTFEMAASVMEMRRLGIAKKPMIVVPNSVVEQWGVEFKRLYPSAKLLLPTPDDFKPANRKVLMNKISTGDFDAIIIAESQFGMIPMSEETVSRFYNEMITEIETALELEKSEAIARGEKSSLTEKRLTQQLKNLRTKMEKKLDSIRKDTNNISFEELGIDSLVVDEAHRFKNLMYNTKLQISGLGNPDGSAKAFDLLMKVRHLQNLNGGRGIVFATATPVLNSISEIYNWQQYLTPDELKSRGIYNFDKWASVFGKIEDIVEVKPEGNGYRVKKGFARLTNIGQLVQMFRDFTDIKTQDDLHLERPDVKTGTYIVKTIPKTPWLDNYMKEIGLRAEAIHNGQVKPDEDNMLKITSDGRKAALDPRLVDPEYTPSLEEGNTKIDVAVEHLFEQWDKTKKDRLTHLVFLEFSTPKGKDKAIEELEDEENGGADNALDSLYQDIKRRLISKGVPADEIAFIHDAKTSTQKLALQKKFNDGEIRILIGNNEKMGVGTNLQVRTKTITHIDFPWRPKDLQQEDGRGLRYGNINKEIELYVLVTEGSFDARLWDNLQRKSRFIDDLMTADTSLTEVEDIGVQTLSFQEVVGLASGNPLMKEQVDVTQKIIKLQNLEKGYIKQRNEYTRDAAVYRSEIKNQEKHLEELDKDLENVKDTKGDNFIIKIDGKTYSSRKEANIAIVEIINDNKGLIKEETFKFSIEFAGIIKSATAKQYSNGSIGIKFESDNTTYTSTYFNSSSDIIQSLENEVRSIPKRIDKVKENIKFNKEELAKVNKELEKKFEKGDELAKLVARQNEIMNILNPPQTQNASEDETEDSYSATESFTSKEKGGPTIGKATGKNTSGKAKRASEIFKEFGDKLDVAIKRKRSGRDLGTFNNHTYIIRIKKANDIPVLSHEVGHLLDREYVLSNTLNKAVRTELESLGAATSKPSYGKATIRKEGIAEFVRLYLTDADSIKTTAPETLKHFEGKVPEEVLKVLKDFRQDIWDLTNLDAVNRVKKSIHFKGDKENRTPIDIIGTLRKIYTGVIDMTYPVEYSAGEIAGKRAKKKISNMLSRFRGYEGVSLHDVFDNQTNLDGKVVGDSLQKVLAPVLQNEEIRKDFVTYQVSRRAMDYFKKELELPDTKETYEAAIKELEGKYPEFSKIFENVMKYRKNNTHLLVESGIYSDDEYQEMVQNHQNYTPLKRIIEAVSNKLGSGRSLSGARRVVKKVVGGGEDIIDPMESDINNTFIYRSVAIRNQILSQLADYADTATNKGYIMAKSERKIKATDFNLEQVKKVLEDQGIDTSSIDLDIMVKIWSPNYLAGPNQVVIYRNGDPELYDIHPELYAAVSNLTPEMGGMIVKALSSIANVSKTGIIFTPKYLMYNSARDTLHNLIASEVGINPLEIIGGFYSVLRGDEYYNLAKSRGGTVNHFSANDRKFAQEAINDMMAGMSKARKFWNNVKHPFVTIQDLIEPTEMGGRLAEFKKHLKKLGHSDAEIEQAITDMRRLSIDFRRMGAWVKKSQLNRITNFLNSQLQGLDNVVKLLIKHPIRTSLRSLLYITLPTLFLMWVNKDNENYKELPWYRRDFFFNIPIGDPKSTRIFLPIPRPWEMGLLFGALPERLITKVRDDDPHAFDEFMQSVEQTIVPELTPSALQPVLEDFGGVTWNGKPILSESDKRVSPELQYNEYTSETSKAIADILKNTPAPESLKSPKRLDHLIRGYTGTLGSIALDSIDQAAGKKEGIPVIGGLTNNFIADAYRSPQSVNVFYNNKNALDTLYSDSKRLKRDMPAKDMALRQAFAEFEDTISQLNDLKRAVEKSEKFTKSEKQLNITAINAKIIELANKANDLYEKNK